MLSQMICLINAETLRPFTDLEVPSWSNRMSSIIYSCDPKTINHKPKAGRPVGAINKSKDSIRWGFVEAYRLLGGVEGLVKWGRKKPDLFYPLLKSLIPTELAESGLAGHITVIVQRNPNQSSPTVIGTTTGSETMQIEANADEEKA